MTDSYKDAFDDQHSSRAKIESVQQPEHTSTHDAQEGHLRGMLGSNMLRGRANAAVRASAIQQAQRLHGNRAVQRFMQRQSGEDALPVQRSPWSDYPMKPICPIISVGPQMGCRPLGGGGGATEPTVKPPPGKKKKGEKPVKTKGKGHKGGKPGETDDKGGFTMTLEDFIKLTGYNPLDHIGGRGGPFGGGFGRGDRWP